MTTEYPYEITYWDTCKGPTDSSIHLEFIDHFDARGKRRVYGRGDYFGRMGLHMDVWQSRDGRLFVRFWSRSRKVDWYSYEIIGLPDSKQRCLEEATEFSEHWIPECLREEYDNWVLSELSLVD